MTPGEMKAEEPSELMLQEDIAAMFRCDVKLVNGWVKRGFLPPARKIGRLHFWLRDEIKSWLRQRPKEGSTK